ncbi:MAG: TM2 domain-containing protein [Bacteroidetes bacterium]|jgi:hypothetical protein|nr:TM2 domain-containing protein [Bacteroidota bacterium]
MYLLKSIKTMLAIVVATSGLAISSVHASVSYAGVPTHHQPDMFLADQPALQAQPETVAGERDRQREQADPKEKDKPKKTKQPGERDNQLSAIILAGFGGQVGLHRYYLGYTWQGVVQTATLGGFGVWALIDLYRIANGTLKPKGREYGRKL